jgi:hypothetical protein
VSESGYLSLDLPAPKNAVSKGGIDLIWDFTREILTLQFKKGNKNTVETYTKAERDAAFLSACSHNAKGYDVYYMVNEGDGVTLGGGSTPRNSAAVRYLTNCFIDADGLPLSEINQYLTSIDLEPSLVVESSPGRYHIYFTLADTAASASNVKLWKSIQTALFHLSDETKTDIAVDRSMADTSKLLRVPCFTHVSKKYTVTVLRTSAASYTLQDLAQKTSAHLFTKTPHDPNHSYTPPQKINAGERHNKLVPYALYLANLPIPDHEKLSLFRSKIFLDTEHPDSEYRTLENNEPALTPEAIRIFTNALHKVELERQTALTATARELAEKNESPWELPDTFYTSAPNGFGHIVQQVLAHSMFPVPSLAFGAFLTGASAVKALTHLTPHKSSPSLYTLNVAISGYGKSDPLTMLQNTLVESGLSKLIENEIRSDRGILEHLRSSGGTGLFIVDEIGHLLNQMLTSDEAYMAGVKRQLLQLSNAGTKKGHTLGKTSDYSKKKKDEQAPVIDCPALAICGFTVPAVFNKIFTLESIREGIFSRFIPIVSDIRYIEANPNADKAFTIRNSPFFSAPVGHVPELLGEAPNGEEKEVPPLVAPPPRIAMRYTEAAYKRFMEILNHYRKLSTEQAIRAIKEGEEDEDVSPVYTRIAENIEKIAATLSPGDIIDLDTLEYAHTFMESRLQATINSLDIIIGGSTVGGSNAAREDKVIAKVASAGGATGKRDLYHKVRKSFRNMAEFDQTVSELVKQERLCLVKQLVGKTKQTKTFVKLADVLE